MRQLEDATHEDVIANMQELSADLEVRLQEIKEEMKQISVASLVKGARAKMRLLQQDYHSGAGTGLPPLGSRPLHTPASSMQLQNSERHQHQASTGSSGSLHGAHHQKLSSGSAAYFDAEDHKPLTASAVAGWQRASGTHDQTQFAVAYAKGQVSTTI